MNSLRLVVALLLVPAPADSAQATALKTRVEELTAAGDYATAESLAVEVVRLQTAESGRQSIETADALRTVASIRVRNGKSDDDSTLAMAEEAVAIKNDVLGPDSPELPSSLVTLGTVRWNRGQYDEARAAFERALRIQERSLPPDHDDFLPTWNGLAIVDGLTGDFDSALEGFRRVVGIRENQRPRDDLELATSLGNVAWILEELGRSSEALEINRRVLAIRESVLGPEHPDVARALNDVGLELWHLGDLAGARDAHQRALSIREQQLGEENPFVAQSLNNLAIVHRLAGDFSEAVALYRRALAIREAAQGPDHLSVAIILNNLGNLYGDMEDDERAIDCHRRALEIRRARLGNEHPLVGLSLNALAEAECSHGDQVSALAHVNESLSVLEASLGKDHPEVAFTWLNLAEILRADGDLEGAEQAAARGVSIRENTLGPDHFETASAQIQLANLRFASGGREDALELMLLAEATGRAYGRNTMQTLPERQALRLASVRPSGVPFALSYLSSWNGAPLPTRRVWDAVVRSRALVLEEMAARTRWRNARSESLDLADSLQTAREKFGVLVREGPGDADDPSPASRIRTIRRQLEHFEETLARESAPFRAMQRQASVGLNDVLGSIHHDEAILAYVRFPEIATWDSPMRWGAFVGRAGREPTFVALGAASTIDSLIAQWRSAVDRGRSRLGGKEHEREYRRLATDLRGAVWDPVSSELDDARLVYVVPEGDLHLVNFAALPTGDDTYLVERGPTLHYLTTERELVTDREGTEIAGTLLAMGDPDFDVVPSESVDTALPLFRGTHTNCASFRDVLFTALPASGEELEAVTRSWEGSGRHAESLRGENADETLFKERSPGAQVLHLATHGFFVGSDCPSAWDVGEKENHRPDEDVASVVGEAPLLRAGLALAGANRRDDVDRGDDGVLTAEEVASLDLSSVRLAVLSGCDTGVGQTAIGEGVLGLRRAFEIAGARSLVMSLWPVTDRFALEWMERFYARRLEPNMSTSDAAWAVSRELLAERRDAGESTHPAQWAAFVVSGAAERTVAR